MTNDLRSELAKVKGLGSAKSGAHHWWHQRLTSIIMVPLFIWLLFFIKCNSGQDLSAILASIHKPYNIVSLIILITSAFYHSMLGMRVIIEDYVANVAVRVFFIVLIQLFCITTVISILIALLSMITI